MASRYAAIMAKQAEDELKEVIPETIADIPETSNCYFVVYEGPYSIAEGSLISIKYKLPLIYLEKDIRSYEKSAMNPRIVTIRF